MGKIESETTPKAGTTKSNGSDNIYPTSANPGASSVGAHSMKVPAGRLQRQSNKNNKRDDSGTTLQSTPAASSVSSMSTAGAHSMNVPVARLGENKTKRDNNGSGISCTNGTDKNNRIRSNDTSNVVSNIATASSPLPSVRAGARAVDLPVSRMGEKRAKRDARSNAASCTRGATASSFASTKERRYSHEIDVDDIQGHLRERVSNVDPRSAAFDEPKREQDVEGPPNSTFPQDHLNNKDLAVALPVEDTSTTELPVAQDFDPEEQAKRRKEEQTKSKRKLFFAAVVLLGIVALVLGLSLSGGETTQATIAPSAAPSMAPTTLMDGVLALLPGSTRTAIETSVGSAQERAFAWLMGDDSIKGYPDWRVIQRFALATVYYALNGDEWYNNTNWLSYETHECHWPNFNTSIGVIAIRDEQTGEAIAYEFQAPTQPCSSRADVDENEVVRHLWLADNGLEGSIPEEIGLLSSLQSLALHESNRGVTGAMPTQLGLLTQLDGLALSFADLQGTPLPSELGLCTKLRVLEMSRSNIGGSIPTEIGLMTSLEIFIAAENMEGDNTLTGSFPSEIGNLEQARILNFGRSGIGGQIPTELGLLENVYDLEMGGNNFNGTIPTQLGQMTSLQFLNLPLNQLSGTIPSELGKLAGVFFLILRNNLLSGSIPSELGQMIGAYQFSLRNNQLSGTIPTELGNLGQLFGMDSFFVSDNQLAGPIPSELGKIPSVEKIWLHNNALTGEVPPELGSLNVSLKEFNISNTDISGSLPTDLCFLSSSNCTYFVWFMGMDVSCVLDFDCSDSLCGCGCPCF